VRFQHCQSCSPSQWKASTWKHTRHLFQITCSCESFLPSCGKTKQTNITAFPGVIPRGLAVINQTAREIHCLHLQGGRVSRASRSK
jgi:hypothetical protein